MRQLDSCSRPAHRLPLAGWFRKRVEQVEKLRKCEGLLQPRATVDDGGSHVHAFESDHEVPSFKIDAGDALRAMAREVEAITLGDLHRLRKSRHRSELERPEGGDRHWELSRPLGQQRRRQGAPKAVSGADEGNAEAA